MRPGPVVLLLTAALLVPSVAAQLPEPTTSTLTIDAFDDGPGAAVRGGTLEVRFDVTLVIDGAACATAGSFDVVLSAEPGAGIRVTFHPDILTYGVDAGAYSSNGPNGPYRRTVTANATISVAQDATGGASVPYELVAELPGPPAACSGVPPASVRTTQEMTVQGSGLDRTPGPGLAPLLAVIAAAAVGAARRDR